MIAYVVCLETNTIDGTYSSIYAVYKSYESLQDTCQQILNDGNLYAVNEMILDTNDLHIKEVYVAMVISNHRFTKQEIVYGVYETERKAWDALDECEMEGQLKVRKFEILA